MVQQILTDDLKQHWLHISSDLLHNVQKFDLVLCDFWRLPKLENCPEGTKICWHSWHPTQRDVTAKYSGKTIFKTVPASGIIISQCAYLRKESISKATAVARAQVSEFCFHSAIPGIKLSHYVLDEKSIVWIADNHRVHKTLTKDLIVNYFNPFHTSAVSFPVRSVSTVSFHLHRRL
jgi:hypothetical protein